jgi:prepilin-type N-terminal cleavage/methylation domain-containing protein
VKTLALKNRVVREESGFSLPEMLVTIVIMMVVFFALYSIFDMSIRLFNVSNDKVEATENARLGLEKMEREIRQAYPYDKSDEATDYLFPPGGFATDSMTFGNDLDGDYTINSATEEVTYSLSAGSPATLLRNGEPMVEFVQDVDDLENPCVGQALTFEYMDEAGDLVADEESIQMVRIALEVAVDRGIQEKPVTQTLTTDVFLRNRGNSAS